jgi:hypothetical protein
MHKATAGKNMTGGNLIKMSAETSLQTYSNTALEAAIAQLARSGEWPSRLRQLKNELNRRKAIKRP